MELDQFWEVTIKQTVIHKLRVKTVGRRKAKNKALYWLDMGVASSPKQETQISANAASDQETPE